MNDKQNSLRNLFNEAVEITDAAERAAYLLRACGDDASLRQRLDQLLKAHADAGGFLGGAGGTAILPVTEKPGDRIGRYKLLQQIGEGGCGVVYMAEQEEPVRRRVALKVIKLGMDTKSVIARFEAERQALALMDHPNIARVLDAGATDTGRPYFVMELVKGMRITEYCDQNNLPTTARLDLFTQVCHAIQHAHQKGIIHRDIKPSNILVTLHDGVPVPKVIDFGIAKATDQRLTDKTLFTAFEQFMGTPAYMSPEQAEMSGLDIDTRSDIYALGVLLYELLTGKPPFDGKELLASGLDAMRRTIREQEPARPSTRLSTMLAADLTIVARHRQCESAKLTSSIRGDLDWIVLKALEKDRTRRYDTANGLAVDIRRYLADEPVSAAAPSAGYRFSKFARRNKAAFGVAAAFAAILVVATVASTWQAIRATRERDAKEKARQEAQAISTFLTEVFRSPDPERDGRTITVAEILDRAVRKSDTDLASQPARRVTLQATLGSTYRALGLPRDALPLLEKARDYCLATFGREHPTTLGAMNNLAACYHETGRRDEALKMQEAVLAINRRVNGPEHPHTLGAMHNLAVSYQDAGRRVEALKMCEEVLALRRKVSGPEHHHTLSAMQNLANSYADAGCRDEALKMREDVLALNRKVNGPEHPDTLSAMHNLATSYHDSGRRDDALKMREDVLALNRKVNGPDHPDTLGAMGHLATSYHDSGRRDEALKMREEVLTLSRKVNGAEHPDTLRAMGHLATSYHDCGRRDEALKMREEVLALSRKVNGPEHPDTLQAMQNLANSYAAAGRRDEALKMGEEVLALSRKVNGPEHSETLGTMNNLANSYANAGRRDEALKMREEVLPLRRKVSGAEHADTLMAMNNLALSYAAAGRSNEELKLREEFLTLRRKVNGPEHGETLDALQNLVIVLDRQGKLAEAETLLREALTQVRKPSVNDPSQEIHHLGMVLHHLADVLRQRKELAEARSLAEEAAAMYQRHSDWPLKEQQCALRVLEAVLTDLGDFAGLETMLREELASARKSATNDPSRLEERMSGLAENLYRQRRYSEAEPLYREFLTSRRARLSPNSGRVGDAVFALGRLLFDWGQTANTDQAVSHRREGEELLREFLSIARQRYASEPPELEQCLHDLAEVFHRHSKFAEAEPLLREELASARKSATNDPPRLEGPMSDLAENLYRQSKYAEAEPLFREVLASRRARLAADSGDGLDATFGLGCLLSEWATTDTASTNKSSDRARESEQLFRDYLGAARRHYTNAPAKLEDRLYRLAEVFLNQGKHAEAEPLYREVLQSQRNRLPAEDDHIIVTTVSLARLLTRWSWAERESADKSQAAERANEAETLLREGLAVRTRTLKEADRRIADTQSRLGAAIVTVAVTDPALTPDARKTKLTEAELLLLQSLESLQQNKKAGASYQRDTLTRLVRLYEAWDELVPNTGKATQAAEWEMKLANFDKAELEKKAAATKP